MSAKRIAIVLSGCGNKDGTEITEAISLIVGLNRGGAELDFFAPDMGFQAKNFLTGAVLEERNMLLESARISRSKMMDLKNLDVQKFDALAFPGGFGAAQNLCNWDLKGAECDVLPEVRKAIEAFHQTERPIGGICVAPVLLARVLGSFNVELTLGDAIESADIIREVKKTGALHEVCPIDDYITDRANKVITTPAFMYGKAKYHQVFDGIQAFAKELLEMA